MKNIYFILILLFSINISFSQNTEQNNYRLELNSGTNTLRIAKNIPDIDTSLNFIAEPEFQTSINAERLIGKHFAFGTGAQILTIKYGYKDIEESYYYENDETKILLDFSDKENYLQIPVFVKYYVLSGKRITPYLQITYTNRFFMNSNYKLNNYRIEKDQPSDYDIFYQEYFLEYLNLNNKLLFSQTEIKYQHFIFLSAGLNAKLNKKIYAGFDLSLQTSPMFIKYFLFGNLVECNLLIGINL